MYIMSNPSFYKLRKGLALLNDSFLNANKWFAKLIPLSFNKCDQGG